MCKRNKKENQIDRRSFLLNSIRGIGTGVMLASPLEIMLGNILMGVFQRAEAMPLTDESFLDKKFINVTMPGGPPRWMWDLPLQPNGTSDPFLYNKNNDPLTSMLITKIGAGSGPGGIAGSYASVKVGNFYLPYLWSSRIPTSDGGSVQMSALAQNMLMMRGVNMLIDSHDLDRLKAVVPAAGSSMTGLAADAAQTMLPAIGVGAGSTGGGYYLSKKGVPFQDMTGSNPFDTAFTPFKVANASNYRTLNSAGTAIDNALDIMKKHSADKHRYLPSSYQDRVNAKKLMLTQFGGLQASFNTLLAKYESLISRSFGDTSLHLAGLEDIAIPGDGTSKQFKINLSQGDAIYAGSDLRSVTTTNTTVVNMAAGFAVAEYMIAGDLSASLPQSYSSALHIMLGNNVSRLMIDAANGTNNATFSTLSNVVAGTTNDAHETGSYAQLIVFSRFYRALSACLYEFIRQLKMRQVGSGTLFNQSVIAVNAEFNRVARADGSGADHGFDGSCYTVLSGMIPQTTVVGNILKSGRNGSTWGNAAPMREFAGQTPLIGNAASTVAMLLDLKTPTPNNPPFVHKDNNGAVTVTVSGPQNKE